MPLKPPKIALALAGGGPLGAIYEVGALCALQDCLKGLDFTRLGHYVGVSAGGFISASLANGITPRELCSAFIDEQSQSPDAFNPAWLMQPAYGEFARRTSLFPRLVAAAVWRFLVQRKSFSSALEHLSPVLPTGVFSGSKIDKRLSEMFNRDGRTNDFRKLKTRLTLVATDLDSAEATPFGRKGWDHVPISQAVQASAALPGLFSPVLIDGHYYVDGALKKTMHASIALEDGDIDLLICLNPLVPFDASPKHDAANSERRIPRIVEGGLPAVLSQTFRSLIHSRMELGMQQYAHKYPNTDIILIEPDHQDPELYLANTFSYSQRRHLAQHAYEQTRQLLRSKKSGFTAKLKRHGIVLNHAALKDPERRLCGTSE